MKRTRLLLAGTVLITLAIPVFAQEKDVKEYTAPSGDKIREWTVQEKDDQGNLKDVKYMTINGILVHETDPQKLPPPRVVTPAPYDKPGEPPSDAVVLFDGTSLDGWEKTDPGKPGKWIIRDGVMMPTKDAGDIRTKEQFGSCQLHIEWATPVETGNSGQDSGNSGVFLMGEYEIQILNSYENSTYPDGQAGAIYGRKVPLVNACRKPGEWQTYDIVFYRPIFDDQGNVVRPAVVTVFHNGVLIHHAAALSGATWWEGPHAVSPYKPHGEKGPLMLQDHGHPVKFRNIWYRPLED